MKKAYEELNYDVIRFRAEDIITTSGDSLLDTSPDGSLGLYLTSDGHYVVKDLSTGEVMQDLGTKDPRTNVS